jgi:O-antigen/teichoic acid export membrane protein
MATASTKFAAERYAQRDADGEATTVWTALVTTTVFTSAIAAAAGIAAPVLMSHVLRVHGHLFSLGVLTFRLVCIATVAYAVSNIVNTPQQVRLRWRTVTLGTSGPLVVQIAATPLALAATAGGIAVAGVLLVAACAASAALNFIAAARLQPRLLRPRFAIRTLRPMLKYGGALALAGFASIPLVTAERLFLAHFHSPAAVADYAVAASLGSLLAVIPAAVAQPLFSALTRLLSQGRRDEHRSLYDQTLKGAFLLVSPAAFVIAFLAQPFLTLWAGPRYGVHSVVPLYLILVGFWFTTIAYVPLTQLLASGATSTVLVVHAAELAPYLGFAAAMTAAAGPIGAAAAWSFRSVVDGVVWFAVARRRYHLPWRPTPTRGLRSLVGLSSLGLALSALSLLTSSLPTRVGWSVIVLLLYTFITWRAILSPHERLGLVTLSRAVLATRRGYEDFSA